MKIKLSDYILEQSISDASASDIVLEQNLAGVEVAKALCEAYIKHIDAMIYSEAAYKDKKRNVIDLIVDLIKMFCNFVRRIFTSLKSSISESKIRKILQKLKNMPESEKKSFVGYLPFKSTNQMHEWTNGLHDIAELFTELKISDATFFMQEISTRHDIYSVKIIDAKDKIKKDMDTIKRMGSYQYTHKEYTRFFSELLLQYKMALSDINITLNGYKVRDFEKIKNDTTFDNSQEKFIEIYKDLKELYKSTSSYLTMYLSMILTCIEDASKSSNSKNATPGVIGGSSSKFRKEIDPIIPEIFSSAMHLLEYEDQITTTSYFTYAGICKSENIKRAEFPVFIVIRQDFEKYKRMVEEVRDKVNKYEKSNPSNEAADGEINSLKKSLEEFKQKIDKMMHNCEEILSVLRKHHIESSINQMIDGTTRKIRSKSKKKDEDIIDTTGEYKEEYYLQEAATIERRFMALSPEKKASIERKGLFGKLFGKSKEEQTAPKLPDDFPISAEELKSILTKIDSETKKPMISIGIGNQTSGNVAADASVIGGLPPYVGEIPTNPKGKQLRFLIQINCKNLNSLPDFPHSGIIQVWLNPHLYSDAGEYKVLYFKDTKGQSKINELDKSIYDDNSEWCLSDNSQYLIGFKNGTNYLAPYSFDEIDDYDEMFAKYWNQISSKKIKASDVFDIIKQIPKEFSPQLTRKGEYNPYGNKLGGYPGFTQSDPRGKGWTPENNVLLLQLDSVGPMMWGDCGTAQVFIKKNDLEALNFSNALYDWACY
jgi:uncharacterized protein YwqG